VTEAELKEAILDLIPTFNPKVFRQAAKLNRPPSSFWFGLKLGTAAIALSVGGIWLVNRPIPWIRYPVMEVAPFLLTPSYMAMDHNYRRAIALVEQSDQLVNEATAFEDLDLGTQKVKSAQKHLDELPAWFLGHYPDDYCRWARCYWRFTIDEFKSARQEIGRMEAKLFQEKNAQTRFEQIEQALGEAVRIIRNGATGETRTNAISDWRSAIDSLNQLPSSTLAGRLAQNKLSATERDFKEIVGFQADSDRNSRLIEVAEISANAAKQKTTKAPMSVIQLEQVQESWKGAITKLEQIKVDDPDYVEAQSRKVAYLQNLNTIEERIQIEQESIRAYEIAERMSENLISMADPKMIDRAEIRRKFQNILNQLDKVNPNTTVYARAEAMRVSAEKRMK
jgi:tetratricopeptide (TPR) repeat protein